MGASSESERFLSEDMYGTFRLRDGKKGQIGQPFKAHKVSVIFSSDGKRLLSRELEGDTPTMGWADGPTDQPAVQRP